MNDRFEMPDEERERRWQSVRKTMAKRGLDALVIYGAISFMTNHGENIRYLTNIVAQGYLLFPAQGQPTLFSFNPKPGKHWVDWRAGHPAYAKAIAERLRELHLERGRLGIVGVSGDKGELGFPHAAYMRLVEFLPGARLEDAGGIIEEVRRIKSAAEIRCLELGCEAANKVFDVVLTTAKAGVRDSEVRTRIVDALFRNGCDPDCMIFYSSGKTVSLASQSGYLQPAGTKTLETGDVILMEFDAKYLGYMAQHNQSFSVGEPGRKWRNMFGVATDAFFSGLKVLKAGITAGVLEEACLTPINKSGYVHGAPSFHGIGLASEEPVGSVSFQPDRKPNMSLVLKAGMVLELQPHVCTPDEKMGIHLGCPVLVTKTGYRLLNKSWKPEFKVA